MRWLYGRTSGVFGAAGNAAVSAFQTPRMAVQVSDGTGWLADQNGLGCVWWIDNNASGGSPLALAIDAADAVYNRIDRVIVLLFQSTRPLGAATPYDGAAWRLETLFQSTLPVGGATGGASCRYRA